MWLNECRPRTYLWDLLENSTAFSRKCLGLALRMSKPRTRIGGNLGLKYICVPSTVGETYLYSKTISYFYPIPIENRAKAVTLEILLKEIHHRLRLAFTWGMHFIRPFLYLTFLFEHVLGSATPQDLRKRDEPPTALNLGDASEFWKTTVTSNECIWWTCADTGCTGEYTYSHRT